MPRVHLPDTHELEVVYTSRRSCIPSSCVFIYAIRTHTALSEFLAELDIIS